MNVECFLDTNVLVYAVGGRGPDEWKRDRAFEIMTPAHFGTSGQVLQEFFVSVTRKIKTRLSTAEAAEWIERLSLRPVWPVDASLVKSAIGLAERYRISYGDAAIIAAAENLRAPILYSEDLSHGQSYGSVRVINPFRPN
jgi:predicted nucleic acid-binding protein